MPNESVVEMRYALVVCGDGSTKGAPASRTERRSLHTHARCALHVLPWLSQSKGMLAKSGPLWQRLSVSVVGIYAGIIFRKAGFCAFSEESRKARPGLGPSLGHPRAKHGPCHCGEDSGRSPGRWDLSLRGGDWSVEREGSFGTRANRRGDGCQRFSTYE
jgi:hypothetical protein